MNSALGPHSQSLCEAAKLPSVVGPLGGERGGREVSYNRKHAGWVGGGRSRDPRSGFSSLLPSCVTLGKAQSL